MNSFKQVCRTLKINIGHHNKMHPAFSNINTFYHSYLVKILYQHSKLLSIFYLGIPDVLILRAVLHVLPGYMAGHAFVPLFETFVLH
jgi:hypothetical protein